MVLAGGFILGACLPAGLSSVSSVSTSYTEM